ncbi:MAG: hypothetical protein ACXWH0_04645 [Acidimicrobiia bacterium]
MIVKNRFPESVLSLTRPKRALRATYLAVALGVVAFSAGGCSSTEGATTTDAGSSTTTAAASTTTTTTTVTSTTTTVASTTTTVASTTTTVATTTTTPDTNSLADGSGCTPGTTTGLPDGEWFGYIQSAATGSVGFDLACWFTGEPAALAAAEDGEESPPPNDYYVRNVNSTVRTLTVAVDAGVTWLASPGDPSTEEMVPFVDWLAGRAGRSFQPGVWLTIESGAVGYIREQYTP